MNPPPLFLRAGALTFVLAAALPAQDTPARGARIFSESLCATCHTVDGSGGKVGPDLGTIGDKFSRDELRRAIEDPSAAVAVGFGTTVLELADGSTLAGVVRSAGGEELSLMTAEGVLRKISNAEIRKREESTVSLMPAGLQAAFAPQDYSDLLDWLASRRTPEGLPGLGDGTVDEIPVATARLELEEAFPGVDPFDEPTWLGWIPGAPGAVLVLEHAGRSFIVENGQRRPFLDLSGKVRRGGATGLLACAFHPDFERNRRYFLKYQIVENGVISTLLEERRFAPATLEDAGEARQLLKIRAVTQDHNGGSLGFGPDGFLYLGMGDTGPQGDPQGHGQDLGILLGKILRLDVDRKDPGLEYAIPAENPFVGREGVRPEIWAYGFREPWRLSWDRETGDLWVGDVGQGRFEEVAIVRKGENHGWNVYEAHRGHSERFRRAGEAYVPPVLGYSHRIGLSVTGGHVYRGSRAPQMRGWYVFGDYESRRIWALRQHGRKATQVVEIGRAPSRLVTFAEDPAGELYLAGFNDGVIRRLDLAPVDPRPREIRVVAATAEREPVSWRYTLEPPDRGWMEPDFNAAGWRSGEAGFGSDNTPGTVVRTPWNSRDIWLRREFQASAADAAPASRLILRLHHDEDVVIFLNGEEILSRPRWTTGYIEEELPAAVHLREGRNVLAVHCRQNSGGQYIDVGISRIGEGR